MLNMNFDIQNRAIRPHIAKLRNKEESEYVFKNYELF